MHPRVDFDAVSSNSKESLVIVFYFSTDLGFEFRLPGAAISADIFVSFEDGSTLFYPVNSLPGSLGSATVVSEGQGASGVWKSTGFEFKGTDDLSKYTVTIDNPLLGVKGTMVLDSVGCFSFVLLVSFHFSYRSPLLRFLSRFPHGLYNMSER